jgi:hypothetical protein
MRDTVPEKKPRLVKRNPVVSNRTPAVKRTPLYGLRKAPNPIDPGKYPPAIDEAATVELTQIQKGFRQRLKEEASRAKKMTEAFYYTVLVFETKAQCDAFIKQSGCAGRGSDLFIDGRVLADLLKIRLPDAGRMTYNPGPTKRSDWSDLV